MDTPNSNRVSAPGNWVLARLWGVGGSVLSSDRGGHSVACRGLAGEADWVDSDLDIDCDSQDQSGGGGKMRFLTNVMGVIVVHPNPCNVKCS